MLRYTAYIEAVEIARRHGTCEKRFRKALRAAKLPWHSHQQPWIALIGSPEHKDMERVMQALLSRHHSSRPSAPRLTRQRSSNRDEEYIIDLCDALLGKESQRQHRFPFLLGDLGKSGKATRLPVDAYYPDLALVIEYHEKQHHTHVAHFNRDKTVSGMPRTEQRKRYDQRRRDVLPAHGITLIELPVTHFPHNKSGRLLRTSDDRGIIQKQLQAFLCARFLKAFDIDTAPHKAPDEFAR